MLVAMRNTVQTTLTIVLAALLALGMGCRPRPPKDAAPGQRQHVVGVSLGKLTEPRRAALAAEIEAAAKEHGELTLLAIAAAEDAAAQAAQIDALISARADLLIVCPQESQLLTEPVARAMQVGIPVIVVDRPVIGDQYTCFLQADNVKIGRAAGAWLARRLGEKRMIVELKGAVPSLLSAQRHEGFRDALRDPSFRVIDEVDVDGQAAKAQKEMAAILSRFKQIDAVFAHTDAAARGAYDAAVAVGRHEGILFVGIDGLPAEGQAYVAAGILEASFEHPTGGKQAVETAARIFRGEKPPKQIELPARVFTRDNLARGGDAAR
jgi:ribose transport system substrate-binding protein